MCTQMGVLLTPRFFFENDNPNQNYKNHYKNEDGYTTPQNHRTTNNACCWSPMMDESHRNLSLAFSSSPHCGWNPPPQRMMRRMTTTTTTHPSLSLSPSSSLSLLDGPPTIIYLHLDPNDCDDMVSVLNDDPEEEEGCGQLVLPPATYDVLVPLLNEMYKDGTSEAAEAVWIDSLDWGGHPTTDPGTDSDDDEDHHHHDHDHHGTFEYQHHQHHRVGT